MTSLIKVHLLTRELLNKEIIEKEKDKRTNNSLQSTKQKVKDRAIQTPLNIKGELR
jgi:hypothetical protein